MVHASPRNDSMNPLWWIYTMLSKLNIFIFPSTKTRLWGISKRLALSRLVRIQQWIISPGASMGYRFDGSFLVGVQLDFHNAEPRVTVFALVGFILPTSGTEMQWPFLHWAKLSCHFWYPKCSSAMATFYVTRNSSRPSGAYMCP